MSSDPIRAALERLVSAYDNNEGLPITEWIAAARAALAAAPEGDAPAEALAARSLLEKVARLGDVIGRQTVAQVQQLANQAAAWLRENPPGQPVAIEPRGCPAPGACSCVEPAPMEGEVGELVAWLRAYRNEEFGPLSIHPDANAFTRAATLLQQLSAAAPAVVPVPVGERLPGMALSWWYEPDEDDDQYGGRWTLLRLCGGTSTYTHWLPAHAIPLPQAGEGEA